MPTGQSDREAFSQLTALFLGVSSRQPVLAVTDFLESAVKKLTQLFQAFEKLRKLMYFASWAPLVQERGEPQLLIHDSQQIVTLQHFFLAKHVFSIADLFWGPWDETIIYQMQSRQAQTFRISLALIVGTGVTWKSCSGSYLSPWVLSACSWLKQHLPSALSSLFLHIITLEPRQEEWLMGKETMTSLSKGARAIWRGQSCRSGAPLSRAFIVKATGLWRLERGLLLLSVEEEMRG